MEITGRIIAVLPVQGGISKNGNEWKKQEYVPVSYTHLTLPTILRV